MSEITSLTVNGRTYEIADAYARKQLSGKEDKNTALIRALRPVMPVITLEDYLANQNKALYQDGRVLDVNGASVSNPFYCFPGDKIELNITSYIGNNMGILATYDMNDNLVNFVLGNTMSAFAPIEHTFTEKEHYFRISGTLTYQSSYSLKYTPVENVWENLEEKFSEQSRGTDLVKNRIFSLYGADYRQGFLNATGKFNANGGYRTTDPIFVKSGTKIQYKLKHGTTLPIIALYADSTMKKDVLIDTVTGISGVSQGEYTTPNDGYICFTELMAHTDGYVCFGDTVPDNVRRYVDNKSLGIRILSLGDSIFGNDGQIPEYLSSMTGCPVVLGAIGGSRVSVRGGTDAFQYLDGQNLVQALVTGNWTAQDQAVAALQGTYTWLPGRIAALKAVDMSETDLVIMNWGTNDYTGGQTLEQILSAYETVIDSLQSAYPQLRILITTPIWRYFTATENGDNKVYADATLKQIAKGIEMLAADKRISVLNAYENMPLSYNTAATYFDADSGVHLNEKGNKVYAHLLNGRIRSMY